MAVLNRTTQLTFFFDGLCGLCDFEVEHLKRLDTNASISFEDIHDTNFEARFPSISRETASRVLHGQLASGELIQGLDVTCLAWTLVGKGRWVAWLRWPVIKSLSDCAYRAFALNRGWISKLFTGSKSSCKIDISSVRKKTE